MIRIGGIELYMGPTALGAPDDLEAVVCAFIDESQKTLLVAVQEIDSGSIAERIIGRATTRGEGPGGPRRQPWPAAQSGRRRAPGGDRGPSSLVPTCDQ